MDLHSGSSAFVAITQLTVASLLEGSHICRVLRAAQGTKVGLASFVVWVAVTIGF